MSHGYWIVRLAGVLKLILHAKDLPEAKRLARNGLADLSDPETGIDFDHESLFEWRVEALVSKKMDAPEVETREKDP
jgi:hypothetical protein